MRSIRYLKLVVTTIGLCAGAQALAEESGVQSYCEITNAAGGNPLTAFNLPENTSATDAFCSGLQSHGGAYDQVYFNGPYSAYAVSDQKQIMAKNVQNDSGGHGEQRCLVDGVYEACNPVAYSAYMLNVPSHPDYLAPEFNGEGITLEPGTFIDITPGDYTGVVNSGNNVTINFVADENNPDNHTYQLKTLVIGGFSSIHLVAGDYFIENLDLQGTSDIIVDGPGTARLFLKNNPSWPKFHKVNWLSGPDGTQDPSKLVIVVDDDLTIANNVKLAGYVYSNGNITATGYSKLVGAANAVNIELQGNALVTEDLVNLADVEFSSLTASPAPVGANEPPPVEPPPFSVRHSGTYSLNYEFASENLNPDVLNWTPEGWSSTYLDTQYLAVGSIHGLFTIISGIISFYVDFEVHFPVAHLETTDIETAISAKQGEARDLIDTFDYSITVAGETRHGNWLLSDSDTFATEAERDAATEGLKQETDAGIAEAIENSVTAWNKAFDVLPATVTYGTSYPSAETPNIGYAGFKFDDAALGWMAVLDDNKRLALPIAWPITGFIVGGFFTPTAPAIAGCLAWIAADEVGCFALEDGETGEECTHHPWLYNDPQPVDAAFFAGAIAELTCAAAAPGIFVAADLGIGIAAVPVGDKM